MYDNGGETPNRYTIFYRYPRYRSPLIKTWQNTFYAYRSCGEDPFDRVKGPGAPDEMIYLEVKAFRTRNRKFQVKWSSLPLAVQQVCRIDLDL